jgi:hypothetical protein
VWLSASLYDPRIEPVSSPGEAYAELVTGIGNALEAVALPAHKHLLSALLARAAAGAGELDQASAWLGACDAELDETECRASLRLARAVVETHKGDLRRALDALGDASRDSFDSQRYLVDLALFRANALEQRGKIAEATTVLLGALTRTGTAGARRLVWLLEAHQRNGLELAPRSHPLARLQFAKASAARARHWYGGWVLSLAIGLITGTIGLFGWSLGVESAPSYTLIGVLGCGFALFLLAMARRDARLRAFGVPTVARIQSATPTGNRLNELHQFRLSLNVLAGVDWLPIVTKYHVHPIHLPRITPGTLLPARFRKPRRLALELD